jgi:hypothetical protein
MQRKRALPIYQLLEGLALSQEEKAVLVRAYKQTVRTLHFLSGENPDGVDGWLVALRVIEISKSGVLDPGHICKIILAEHGIL